VSTAIAAIAGVSAWLSLGLVAVTADGTRILALPPAWWLAVLVGAAVAFVQVVRPQPARLRPLLLTLLVWLPFIPGPVPALLLTFEGPIEVGIWAIALVATVGFRLSASPLHSARQHPGLAPVTAVLIAALAYGIGAAALCTQMPIGDEPHYLMITQSLIKDGDMRIENNHRNRDYASFNRFDIPPHYLTRGSDGEIYSVHSPGISVLVLPAFALFGYYGGVATVIAMVAIASGLAWHAAWLLTSQVAAAWIAWAAVFLSAPMFLQAVTVFPDAAGALPVMAGVWLLIALDRRRPITDRALILVGIALAVLPWLHQRFALLAGGLGLAIVLRLLSYGSRRIVLFLAVPVVSALLWFGFFWWVWGSPSPTAPWGNGITSRVEWIPNGVRGLLFDPQAGLLIPAPVYAVALAGWLRLLCAKPRLAVEMALIGAVLTASVASYEAWWGGQGAPARYLVAALPLFVGPAAWLASRGRAWRQLGAYAAVVSVLLLTAKIFAAGGAFTFNPETGNNPLFGWMAPRGAPLSFVHRWQPWHQADDSARAIDLTAGVGESLRPAVRSARLGDVTVFYMNATSYPEPSGFWTRAGTETTVIFDLTDPSRQLGLRLRAGPIPTSAEVTIAGLTHRLSFLPQQRHELAISPAAAGAWKISIRSRDGFRPTDADPESKDSRSLGVWVEVF